MSNANQSVLFIQGGGDDAYDWDAKLARSLEKNLGTGFTVLALYAKAFPQAVTRALPDRNHQLNDDLSEVANDIRKL